jgi:hypothetical protein
MVGMRGEKRAKAGNQMLILFGMFNPREYPINRPNRILPRIEHSEQYQHLVAGFRTFFPSHPDHHQGFNIGAPAVLLVILPRVSSTFLVSL